MHLRRALNKHAHNRRNKKNCTLRALFSLCGCSRFYYLRAQRQKISRCFNSAEARAEFQLFSQIPFCTAFARRCLHALESLLCLFSSRDSMTRVSSFFARFERETELRLECTIAREKLSETTISEDQFVSRLFCRRPCCSRSTRL